VKLNKKRRDEIKCLLYFKPSNLKYPAPTDEDIIRYFEWSEQGKHKDEINDYTMDGFNCLFQCKRWRGITCHEMYEQGVLDGSVPYSVMLDGVPEPVAKFLSKELFKGMDQELIMNIWANNKQEEEAHTQLIERVEAHNGYLNISLTEEAKSLRIKSILDNIRREGSKYGYKTK